MVCFQGNTPFSGLVALIPVSEPSTDCLHVPRLEERSKLHVKGDCAIQVHKGIVCSTVASVLVHPHDLFPKLEIATGAIIADSIKRLPLRRGTAASMMIQFSGTCICRRYCRECRRDAVVFRGKMSGVSSTN